MSFSLVSKFQRVWTHCLVFVLASGYLCASSVAMTRSPDPAAPEQNAPSIEPEEALPVVLLHGLKRSSRSMKKLEKHLSNTGFDVCNVNYPSNRAGANDLAEHILAEIYACFGDDAGDLNFVTHSLGGIMVRVLAATKSDKIDIGRVVMLAPPNKGSELVDDLAGYWIFEKIMGELATELGTDTESLPNTLGPATFEVGVIAGIGHSNPMGWFIYDEPNDGTVSVESMRLNGMVDFVEVPYGHTFIMNKEPVLKEAEHFIRQGTFSDVFKSDAKP